MANNLDLKHGVLCWICHNYEEYIVECDLADMVPQFTKDEFDSMHSIVDSGFIIQ